MTTIQATAASLLLAGSSAFAQAQPSAAAGNATASVTELIQQFARAADRRDVSTLEALLHPAFRVVFNVKPGAAPTVLDRAQYLQMARDGKIGGLERRVAVAQVSLTDGFASGAARMEHDKATFQSLFSLIQSDGLWLLLQEAVLMSPNGAAK